MNKIYLIFFSFLLFFLLQIPVIKKSVIEFSNSVKSEILDIKKNIYEKLLFFSNQQKTIKELKLQNLALKKELNKFEAVYEQFRNLKYFKFLTKPNLVFVKTISYAALPDFSQIYVNYNKPISTPKGLVYNNLAAGIVVKNFGKYSLAYLNSNAKTTYTVIIGDKEVPGIFYGKKNIIKYIKRFSPVKVGDIVKTGGLDGIFYKGALVGRVVEITKKKLYKEAKVKLFYQKLTPDYFYVVEKNGTIKK